MLEGEMSNPALDQKEEYERQNQPPEEVFLGAEEGLQRGAGGEEFGDGEDVEAEDHHENGGRQGVQEFFTQ